MNINYDDLMDKLQKAARIAGAVAGGDDHDHGGKGKGKGKGKGRGGKGGHGKGGSRGMGGGRGAMPDAPWGGFFDPHGGSRGGKRNSRFGDDPSIEAAAVALARAALEHRHDAPHRDDVPPFEDRPWGEEPEKDHGHGKKHGHGRKPAKKQGQQRVLAMLALHDGLRQKDLAYLLAITPQALGEVLAKLEKAGYITREKDENDRRATIVKLTDEGRKKAEEAAEKREKEAEDYFSVLTDEEIEQLAAILDKLDADRKGKDEDAEDEDSEPAEDCGDPAEDAE